MNGHTVSHLSADFEGLRALVYVTELGGLNSAHISAIGKNEANLVVLIDTVINTIVFDEQVDPSYLCPYRAWWNEGAEPLITRFLDTTELAVSTPRAQVSSLVLELQAASRDFERLPYPSCVESIQRSLSSGMKKTIDGFVNFVANGNLVSMYFDMATEDFKTAAEALQDNLIFADIRLVEPGVLLFR